MNEKQIDSFEKAQTQLQSLHAEIGALAKKSPNDALNEFKLNFVNQSFAKSNEVLGKQYRPFADFEQFDNNKMPTNSDITMMLGQYLGCMEKLHADNVDRYGKWLNKKKTM